MQHIFCEKYDGKNLGIWSYAKNKTFFFVFLFIIIIMIVKKTNENIFSYRFEFLYFCISFIFGFWAGLLVLVGWEPNDFWIGPPGHVAGSPIHFWLGLQSSPPLLDNWAGHKARPVLLRPESCEQWDANYVPLHETPVRGRRWLNNNFSSVTKGVPVSTVG